MINEIKIKLWTKIHFTGAYTHKDETKASTTTEFDTNNKKVKMQLDN